MPTLVELASQIVTAQTTSAAMSTEEIVLSLTKIHDILGQLEGSTAVQTVPGTPSETKERPLTLKAAFKKYEVVCMICGKTFKTLALHLTRKHGMTTRQYRKQFAIPADLPLCSKVLFEQQKGQVERLVSMRKAREDKTATEKRAPIAVDKGLKATKATKARKGAKARKVAVTADVPAA